MKKRYELVASTYKNGKFTNEKVLLVGSLIDIDKITCSYHDAKSMILENSQIDFGTNNSISIRYYASSSSRPFYIKALFNKQEMTSIIDGLHLDSFYSHGKKVFTEVVDKKNPYYIMEREEFYNYLDNMGMTFLDEVLTIGGNSEFKRYIRNYNSISRDDLFTLEDIEALNDIKSGLDREFSRYINFRNYIVSKEKYKSKLPFSNYKTRVGRISTKSNILTNNIVINKSPVYHRIDEYIELDDEREEFLELDEISKSVGEGNDIKGYKGYVKK